VQPGTVVDVVGVVVTAMVDELDEPGDVVVVALVVGEVVGLGDEQLARATAASSAVAIVELRAGNRTDGWIKS
jgi:hypothetical protein